MQRRFDELEGNEEGIERNDKEREAKEMKYPFEIYGLDCETTGLSYLDHEIIEMSFYRLSDDSQKTWCLKPANPDKCEQEALRINGHKIEDLKHQTKFGVETYRDPGLVLVEVENWFLEDCVAPTDRILLGQNCIFDLQFLQSLWKTYASLETFPFGKRPALLDTMQIARFLDIVEGKRNDFYNLGSLVDRYGVKKEKAHQAAADTRMTKEVFLAQLRKVQEEKK
jgi:DNA polymerase III alpha subunit (gram-positive type)